MGYQIVIDDHFKDKIGVLLEQYEFSTVKEFTESMVTYFVENGINPRNKEKSLKGDLGDVNKNIAELRKTMVGFIREQEKQKLNPILLKLDDLYKIQIQFMEMTVTKEEVNQLFNTIARQSAIGATVKNTPAVDDNTKYNNLLENVKKHFTKFTEGFKKVTFGGYTLDKDWYDRYVTIFNNMK